jgi:uncharacterized protein YbjT (DUF2867 family)
VADLKDPATLPAACKGVDAVISTVTSVTTAQPGDSFAATDGKGTISLIDAARKAGVKKFVFVSFDVEAAPDAPLPRAKRDVEKHLEKSGMDYTILHPSLFIETWLGPMMFADPVAGTARVYGAGTQKIRYIAVKDVAELVVQSLSRPFASKATIPFGGPEPISQREAVKLFEEAFGKKFAVTDVPEEALEAQWKAARDQLEKSFASLMLGIARGFDSGIEPPYKEFPMQMTSPREYVKRLAMNSA